MTAQECCLVTRLAWTVYVTRHERVVALILPEHVTDTQQLLNQTLTTQATRAQDTTHFLIKSPLYSLEQFKHFTRSSQPITLKVYSLPVWPSR